MGRDATTLVSASAQPLHSAFMDGKRILRLGVVPTLAGAVALTGCGSGSTSGTATSNPPAASGAQATAGATSSVMTITCPTDNTQAFPKVRFVTNVGLASGAFHRWVWKPYQAGTFQTGANGRTTALVKAGLASAFAVKQLHDAKNNVMADPAMCKAFAGPITQLTAQLDGLKERISAGDLAAIEGVRSEIDGIKRIGQTNGMTIVDDESANIGI